MKFKFLTGDVNWKTYGGKFVSKKFNKGDFDYWLVLEVINMKDAVGDEALYTYNVSINAIAPSEVSEEKKQGALKSTGWDEDDLKRMFATYDSELLWVEILSDHGIYAHLWSSEGNNLKKLLKEAHTEAEVINMMFYFYMDRAENCMGNDGWDFISGNIGFNVNREY